MIRGRLTWNSNPSRRIFSHQMHEVQLTAARHGETPGDSSRFPPPAEMAYVPYLYIQRSSNSISRRIARQAGGRSRTSLSRRFMATTTGVSRCILFAVHEDRSAPSTRSIATVSEYGAPKIVGAPHRSCPISRRPTRPASRHDVAGRELLLVPHPAPAPSNENSSFTTLGLLVRIASPQRTRLTQR